jgi:hypothetical protein
LILCDTELDQTLVALDVFQEVIPKRSVQAL